MLSSWRKKEKKRKRPSGLLSELLGALLSLNAFGVIKRKILNT